MDLNKLTAAFLGDSLTEGVGASSQECSYPSVFTKIAGLMSGINLGISGTRIARQTVPFRGCVTWDRDFISRVSEIPKEADLIIILGSTNDYMHGDAELGKITDRSEYTFYGALHSLLAGVLERCPSALTVFMTPPPFPEEASPSLAHINKGHYFSEYIKAIEDVCKIYSVPVFDLHSLSGLDPSDKENKEHFYSDSIHLNDNGYRQVAEKLAEFLQSL